MTLTSWDGGSPGHHAMNRRVSHRFNSPALLPRRGVPAALRDSPRGARHDTRGWVGGCRTDRVREHTVRHCVAGCEGGVDLP